jgi:Tfp pilus assembly protein PilN
MSSSTLALPAPDRGWILLSGGTEVGRGEDLRALAGARGDLVVGLPAACVSTFVVELPLVGEDALRESMILAQVDKRGLGGRGTALVDFEPLGRGETGEIYAVRVVPETPADCLVETAAGYNTSAALRGAALSSPSVALVWREQGRLALAVRSGGRDAHTQLLSGKAEIGAPLAREINLVLLGLRGEAFFEADPPQELVLVPDGSGEGDMDGFRSALSIPVRTETAKLPTKALSRAKLLPAEVLRRRRRRRNAARAVALLAAGLVAYAVAGTWIWKSAKATQRQIESLERRIAIVEPDVERVRLAEERWRALEPAFDKDLFPVVQLSRITSALPGSGVVVREFRTSGQTIRVRGQARDVQLANRLLEDLRGMEGFRRYEWSMPNPRVERNNAATFEIQGKPKE